MEAVKGVYGTMGTSGNYTIADIEALPDGQRAELFDGEMIMMATPTTTHQMLIGELYIMIANYIRSNKGNCEVLFAPFGVFIKQDDRNYLEPDIVVICDNGKLDNKGCHGAPDWVIEIVSPSSRKLAVYMETGVREYWIVNPKRQVITVYYQERSATPVIYRFGDVIQVRIYPDLQIDSTALADIKY